MHGIHYIIFFVPRPTMACTRGYTNVYACTHVILLRTYVILAGQPSAWWCAKQFQMAAAAKSQLPACRPACMALSTSNKLSSNSYWYNSQLRNAKHNTTSAVSTMMINIPTTVHCVWCVQPYIYAACSHHLITVVAGNCTPCKGATALIIYMLVAAPWTW